MTFFGGSPAEGDWIVLIKPVKHSISDYVAGEKAGLRPGTRGVITKVNGWNSLEARLDTGLWGSVTARVKPSQIRVTRRGGSVEAFAATTSHRNLMRAGVALSFIAPVVWFTLMWFIHGGTKDGLIATLLDSAIYGMFDLIAYAASNPIDALIYVALVTAAGRFAFRG